VQLKQTNAVQNMQYNKKAQIVASSLRKTSYHIC